jgi:hypothetical protein
VGSFIMPDGAIGATAAAAVQVSVIVTFTVDVAKCLSIWREAHRMARLADSMYSSHLCRCASYSLSSRSSWISSSRLVSRPSLVESVLVVLVIFKCRSICELPYFCDEACDVSSFPCTPSL